MSKIIRLYPGNEDTFQVTQATLTTGWLAGQLICLDSTGQYGQLATGDDAIAVALDPKDSLSAPPTGSLLTAFYGHGAKFVIDHSPEIAASSAARAYESDVLSASPNANLYASSNAKWTTVSSGSVRGKLFQVPTALNNYGLGIILRM